ncbi:CARDB domain-containing protein [Halarchaeum nitratireducens]|nr:CARDB domain-containing protein [Halarchaeum nitratireducens]
MPRTKRSRLGRMLVATITLLLCCSLLAGAGAASGVTYVTVSDVGVSDDNPTTGDLVTITPTIRHSSAGDAGFQINEVTLTNANGERIAEANDLGTIGESETLDVPLRTTFDTAGDKHLTLHVRGTTVNSSGHTQAASQITHPVYVDVDEPSSDPEPAPRVHIDADSMVAGAESTVTVTVSNGGEDALSDVTLRLDDFGDNIDAQTRVRPTIPAQNMTTFTFTVTPDEAGDMNLKATLTSENEDVTGMTSTTVDELEDTVRVDATTVHENDTTLLQYHVANAGNAPIEDVLVTAESPDGSLPSASVERVNASASETLTVPVGSEPASATLDVSYTVGGDASSTTETIGSKGLESTDSDATTVSGQNAFLNGGIGGIPLGGIALLFGGVVVGGIAGTRLRR